VNNAFERTFGWKKEEVIDLYFSDLMPTYKEDIKNVFTKACQGETIKNYETIRQRKDGSIIYINVTVTPINNEVGEIEYLSSISRDITEQKKAELLQVKAEQELKNAIKHQQGIIFKFTKVNGEFIYTMWDGELSNKLEIFSKDVENRILDEEIYRRYPNLLNKQEIAWNGIKTSFEFPYKQLLLFVTFNPLEIDGRTKEVVGSCIDITPLRQTEELLQKSEKLAVVGQLAAGVAHEIRNPLTTLKGFTQLMLTKPNVHALNPYIQVMIDEIEKIEMITNEFLVIAKPQAVIVKNNNIKHLIERVLFFLQGEVMQFGITVTTSYETNNLDIVCDANQLKQVLINLFKNAIESMQNGGLLTIQVIEFNDDYLKINIMDTGVGMRKELISKLGEPFYTLKEKGTGLGLMVSFRIIEANKGKISYISEENVGTKVELILPKSNVDTVTYK
jgi:PAS domain S-box-containing protein